MCIYLLAFFSCYNEQQQQQHPNKLLYSFFFSIYFLVGRTTASLLWAVFNFCQLLKKCFWNCMTNSAVFAYISWVFISTSILWLTFGVFQMLRLYSLACNHCFLAFRPSRGPCEHEGKSGLLWTWMFTRWLFSDTHFASTRSGCPDGVELAHQ